MDFNKQQKEVIETIEGNICVIASAGSGKTSTLVYRVKNMIENHGILPSSILAVTFSKKAKENIIERLNGLEIYDVNIETFHSLALKIISYAYGQNWYKVWTLQWEKEKALKEICSDMYLCEKEDTPFNEIMSFIALQKMLMLKPADELFYRNHEPFDNENMQNIYKAFEDYKIKNRYIEFDDFLNMANDIFDNDPSTLSLYRNKFQYVLVDEFQDVSLSQALFLKKLNDKNTMIVGDPLQAIYAFRGGNSKFILNFDRDYENVKVVNLNVNYRCSKDIVKTSNKLALSIPDSKHRNYVESIANKECYKCPEIRHFDSDYSESKWISKEIQKLKTKGYSYNDIAILARTNAQLQKLETELHNNNISFDVVNGNLFTDLPEIKLIISYLKLAMNENDDEAFSYIYNKPNRWLDKKFLEEVEMNSKRRRESLYTSMFTIARRNWKFKNGINEIQEVVNRLQKPCSSVGELVKYLRKRLDIDKYVTKGKQADDGSFVEQIDNLDSFQDICGNYKTIKELIDYLDNLNEEMQAKKDECVKLLTIHRSKGMEYPVVFVIGCNEGLLPHYKSDDFDDERRLFYVAMTRAEKELYMSYFDFYGSKSMVISPFIEDIKGTIQYVNEDDKEQI